MEPAMPESAPKQDQLKALGDQRPHTAHANAARSRLIEIVAQMARGRSMPDVESLGLPKSTTRKPNVTCRRDQLTPMGHALPLITAAIVAAVALTVAHVYVVLDLAPATAWTYLAAGMAGAMLGLCGGASFVVNRPSFTK